MREFDSFAFKQATQSKKLVILDFHTRFCPRCRGQSPLVERVITEKRLAHVEGFLVDFEKDMALRKKYDVQFKSTIIFLYQGRELDRVTGEIRHEALEAAIRSGLEQAIGKMNGNKL